MRKRLTRTEKYKEYREEIKNSSLSLSNGGNDVKASRTISQVIKDSKDNLGYQQKKQNKHFLDRKEEKQLEKSVYDIYASKRRWKRFFYFIFVVVIITGLLALFLYLSNRYLGFNLW